MSKCISTAQARTKCGPRSWSAAFLCKFLRKMAFVKCASAFRLSGPVGGAWGARFLREPTSFTLLRFKYERKLFLKS